MKYIKFLLVPMLFVSLAFMNIGGCGGSSGGGGQPTNPPPTNPPPTNPPPTDPPPTNPPEVCQIPALDTDFSDTGYFFFDALTGLTMGVTSTGEVVVIAIVDSFGVSVGAGATPISEFACLIFSGVIGEAVLDADGICGKSDDSTLFLILDFEILGVPFVDETIGECFAVEPLDVAVAQRGEGESREDDIQRAVEQATLNAFLGMQERGEIEAENETDISLGNSLDQIEAPVE
jgi:hypothetical protein